MRVRTTKLLEMKQAGERIPCITAYDYATAQLVDGAGIPLLLVGDSLGNVVLGHDTTLPVTMEDMLHHAKAVVRGSANAMVVVDMPFMSYQVSVEEALRNAGRIMQETGAQAVKLEGGRRSLEVVRRVVEAGIPVMGHLGLTPQSVNQFGGYRVQGRTLADAQDLVANALALEASGAFAIVLETVPAPLARVVTGRLRIPVIGIGAGPDCDGEVQVIHDLLGFGTARTPRHAKRYADLNEVIGAALRRYADEVRDRSFPTEEHSHPLDDPVLAELTASLSQDG